MFLRKYAGQVPLFLAWKGIARIAIAIRVGPDPFPIR